MKRINLEGLPQFLLPLFIAECSTVFSAVCNHRPKGGGISDHGCLSHTSGECPYTAQVQDAARKQTCIFILTNSPGQKPEEKKNFTSGTISIGVLLPHLSGMELGHLLLTEDSAIDGI